MALATAANTAVSRGDLVPSYFEFSPQQADFVGTRILTPRAMTRTKGRLGIVEREAYLQHVNTKVGARAETPMSEYGLSEEEYKLVRYRHKGFIPADEELDFEELFNLEEIEVGRNAFKIHQDLEIDIAALLWTTATFPAAGNTGASPSVKWDVPATATPVSDIYAGHDAIENAHAVRANTLVITSKTYRKVCLTDEFNNRLPTTQIRPGEADPGVFAEVMKVDNVIIVGPGAVKSGTNPGQAATISRIWDDDNALLCRVATGERDPLPSLGWTLELDRQRGVTIDSWDENDPMGRYIRASALMKPTLSPDPVGYLLSNVLT